MSSKKAQAFFEKKKEETKSKMKGKDEGDDKGRDTSKMPEGLRKHFEKRIKVRRLMRMAGMPLPSGLRAAGDVLSNYVRHNVLLMSKHIR